MISDLFCIIDDFCQIFIPHWEAPMLGNKEKKLNRPEKISTSEIITILIHLHKSNFRTFNHYYKGIMQRYYRFHFPDMVSYPRFEPL